MNYNNYYYYLRVILYTFLYIIYYYYYLRAILYTFLYIIYYYYYLRVILYTFLYIIYYSNLTLFKSLCVCSMSTSHHWDSNDISFFHRRSHHLVLDNPSVRVIKHEFDLNNDYPDYQISQNYKYDRSENNCHPKYIKCYNNLYHQLNDKVNEIKKQKEEEEKNKIMKQDEIKKTIILNNKSVFELSLHGMSTDTFNRVQEYLPLETWCKLSRISIFFNTLMARCPNLRCLSLLHQIPPNRDVMGKFTNIHVLHLLIRNQPELLKLFKHIKLVQLQCLILCASSPTYHYNLKWILVHDIVQKKINFDTLTELILQQIPISVSIFFEILSQKLKQIQTLELVNVFFVNESSNKSITNHKYEKYKSSLMFPALTYLTLEFAVLTNNGNCIDALSILLNNTNVQNVLHQIEFYPSSLIAQCIKYGSVFPKVTQLSLQNMQQDFWGVLPKNHITKSFPKILELIINPQDDPEIEMNLKSDVFDFLELAIPKLIYLNKITFQIYKETLYMLLKWINKMVNGIKNAEKIRYEIDPSSQWKVTQNQDDQQNNDDIERLKCALSKKNINFYITPFRPPIVHDNNNNNNNNNDDDDDDVPILSSSDEKSK